MERIYTNLINSVLNGNLTSCREIYNDVFDNKDRRETLVFAADLLTDENLARLVFGLGIDPYGINISEEINKKITEAYFNQYPEKGY